MTRRVTVTQEDIDNGMPSSLRACAVARAVSRAVGEPAQVVLGKAWLQGTSCKLPDEALEFIVRFDDRLPVEPFEFDLECAE